jgi:hypothetical protein
MRLLREQFDEQTYNQINRLKKNGANGASIQNGIGIAREVG